MVWLNYSENLAILIIAALTYETGKPFAHDKLYSVYQKKTLIAFKI